LFQQFDDSSDDNGHIGGSEHHNSEEHLFGAGEHGGNHGESANGKAVAIQVLYFVCSFKSIKVMFIFSLKRQSVGMRARRNRR
jgi:hypothetical protein